MDRARFTRDVPFSVRVRSREESGKTSEREVRAIFLGARP
jgi:hypothetical protein